MSNVKQRDGSVGCHSWVHFPRPGFDAAVQVDGGGDPLAGQIVLNLQAADAMVADDDILARGLKPLQLSRYPGHRNQFAAFEMADPEFPGFAHIDQRRSVSFQLGGQLAGAETLHAPKLSGGMSVSNSFSVCHSS